jgi:hypothetical protein
MAERTLSSNTVTSLSKKLDEFSEALTPDEHAVLLGLLGTASATFAKGHEEAEAEGITAEAAVVSRSAATKLPQLSSALKETFAGMEGIRNPGGQVSDSIGVGWLCVSWSKDIKIATQPGERVLPGVENLRISGLKTYR